MLRVNSDNVLIVPPFEAAWLTDKRLQLTNGKGCVAFEAKGQNDVSIIFKATPGGRRWQFARGGGQRTGPQQPDLERHYTVIIGSHCNTCLKIERNDQELHWVKDEPCATLSARKFQRYWVEYNQGLIRVGCGPAGANCVCSWQDTDPLPGMQFVGLTAWDTYNSYRDIEMHPAFQDLAQQGAVPASQVETDAVPGLTEQCNRVILDSVAPSTVCQSLSAAEALAPALDELQQQLLIYLAQHLPDVVCSNPAGFSALDASTVVQLLLCPLLVCPERDIFDAAMLWYAEAPDAKHGSMQEVLPLIRFPLMSLPDLQLATQHPLAMRHELLHDLVAEALQSRAAVNTGSPSKQDAMPLAGLSVDSKRGLHEAATLDPAVLRRQRRRNLGGARELMYLYDGDHEGVCYHFGTDFGSKQWVNPVLTGRLQVRASSPPCRHTDAKTMVSGRPSRSNLASPCLLADGTRASWWCLDLGPNHRLACNYYTLRHDASHAFLRSWVLQGCEDAQRLHWIDLRQHHSDTSISMHGQYATWSVLGHAATVPCQMFRIVLTGPNANPIAPQDTVCLSNLEFYGYLHDVQSGKACSS